MWLLPPEMALQQAFLLVFAAGFTSFLTAVPGIGGGRLLLAIMAQVAPVAALIAAHGIVQLGSNANRALLTRQHLDLKFLKLFLAGSPLGAVAGYILWMVWGPQPNVSVASTKRIALMGAATTLLSVFVGATGPLVAAFVQQQHSDKMRSVATFAGCMTLQNLLKTAVFMVVGFHFTQWLPLLGAMIARGAAATWIGPKLLRRLPSRHFRRIFYITITLLALRLLWQGLHHSFSA